MGKKKWTRVLALVMAVVCTLTVVGAVNLNLDRNGDGKITVWDLQVLFSEGGADQNYKDAVGTVIDTRTAPVANVFVGALAGRIDSADYTPGGIKISDENKSKLLMKAEDAATLAAALSTVDNNGTLSSGLKTALKNGGQDVLCKMALDYGQITNGKTRFTGIVGYQSKAPTEDSYLNYNWQEISGSITLQSDEIATRRQTAVDKMYDICTVEWKPSEDMYMFMIKGTTGDVALTISKWDSDNTYRGMPYTHGGGSLERFQSWMMSDNKTINAKTTYAYYFNNDKLISTLNGMDKAFSHTNYTDDAIAAKWNGLTTTTKLSYTNKGVFDSSGNLLIHNTDELGDMALSTTDDIIGADHTGFCQYLGNDCSQSIMWAWRSVVSSDPANGGTVITGVTQMAPTVDGTNMYGMQPINGLVSSYYNLCDKKSDGTENTGSSFQKYGAVAYMEAYAQASRGDVLIARHSNNDGHSRMIAYDPIVIRSARGGVWSNSEGKVVNTNSFKADLSYIITHEQGRGSSGTENGVNWESDCYANCVYTFAQLADSTGMSDVGFTGHYLPATIQAFHNEDTAIVASNVDYNMDTGVVSSNYFIVSTQLNGADKVFTAVSQHQTEGNEDANGNKTYIGNGYRDAHVQENMKTTYGEETLSGMITVNLSNGDSWNVDLATGACTKV